jgi:hypothetical protein
MSYSRFGSSVWYTFWSEYVSMHFKLPTKKLKDQQVFEICDFPSYYISYGDIKTKGVSSIIKEVKEFYDREHISNSSWFDKTILSAKNPTIKELQELETYLYQFINDIDAHFNWNIFFYYEWYIPFRNNIRWWWWPKFYNIKNKLWPK